MRASLGLVNRVKYLLLIALTTCSSEGIRLGHWLLAVANNQLSTVRVHMI
jgi:hypothetical protein